MATSACHPSETVLLVEDEPLTALSLAEGLEEGGYRVKCCSTGFDALNYIDMEEAIDVVVTDINLGLGPDGWEIARRARQQFPRVHIVYITGNSAEEFHEHAVPQSVLLQKPLSIATLIGAVGDLVT